MHTWYLQRRGGVLVELIPLDLEQNPSVLRNSSIPNLRSNKKQKKKGIKQLRAGSVGSVASRREWTTEERAQVLPAQNEQLTISGGKGPRA